MHTVKDYSVSEKGNPPPPLHGLLFAISNKGYFKGNIQQTELHTPRSLLYQSWRTGWNEKQFSRITLSELLSVCFGGIVDIVGGVFCCSCF